MTFAGLSTPRVRGVMTMAGAMLAIVLACVRSADAQCTVVTPNNASFGSVTSFVVQSTVQQTSTTNAGLTCQFGILSLLSSDHFWATITSANSGALKGPGTGGADLVPYTVYGDATTSFPIQWGVQFDYATGNLLNLLGLLGSPSASFPMFLRTAPGANVAAGVYTDTITVSWQWDYCTGIGLFGICLGRNQGSGAAAFQVSMTVTPACQISATPDVSLGQAPTAASFGAVLQSVMVLCTKDLASASVGLGPGLQASGGRRQMSNGAHVLQYDLFKSGTGEVWGTSGSARMTSTTPANGTTAQPFEYRAVVYPDQATPPVGVYTDTVVADVSF